MKKGLAERRQHILDAAISCFMEQGYHQTGMRDIAGRAGVSIGNVYNHFAGKVEILTTIAGLEANELNLFIGRMGDATLPLERLRTFVADYSAYSARPENVLLGLEIIAAAARDSSVGAVFVENRERLVEALANLLGELRGGAEAQVPRHETARLILDAIEGQAVRMTIAGRKAGIDELGWLEQFVVAAAGGGSVQGGAAKAPR